MLERTLKVLLIEDNLAEARLLQEFLKASETKQFALDWVKRLSEALNLLACRSYDVILLDLTLPDSQGLASLQPLFQQAPSVPIVVLTHTNDDALALQAVRQGAQDYLVKRFVNTDGLVRSLCYAIERKQVAEALRQANADLELKIQEHSQQLAKAEKRQHQQSEFVSMLSHDFRNPLNTILNSAGLLQADNLHLSEEKKLRLFQLIQVASKDMNRLLDEVLLVGQGDAGHLAFNPTPLALKPFFQQLIDEAHVVMAKNQRLALIGLEGSCEILADGVLLKHIMSNLLSNAIKYSPQGGQIGVEVHLDVQLTIRVTDAGMGIPPQDLQNLFQPFHRACNVADIPGTGLGLTIVKSCVEAHGGEISVESVVGVGTTFAIALPLHYTS
ncbi:MAG: hybrid sensor histidine kinase/response regulator [Jaaginema sp. PMC 1079.18]|nr:hybrid sensor histidine kinase/response regulator [Jaaginema sp. PMC 1080.18]MEC4851796.1 hybrid sensor histidine kinase/response regulator [Jaaginema sp. PMC 1079.18]MEC4867415.1 hybrid sensor histidine kinase/response regulator [Jaaginema sp. PMC 1078.18]